MTEARRFDSSPGGQRQQVIALGHLRWTLRRIEAETGIRRETVSAYRILRYVESSEYSRAVSFVQKDLSNVAMQANISIRLPSANRKGYPATDEDNRANGTR